MQFQTVHSLSTILEVLQGHEVVASSLPLEKAIAFIVLTRHLKPRITFCVSAEEHEPPKALPRSVHAFLCVSLNIENELAKLCWQAFRAFIWATENGVDQVLAYTDQFLKFGLEYEIGA